MRSRRKTFVSNDYWEVFLPFMINIVKSNIETRSQRNGIRSARRQAFSNINARNTLNIMQKVKGITCQQPTANSQQPTAKLHSEARYDSVYCLQGAMIGFKLFSCGRGIELRLSLFSYSTIYLYIYIYIYWNSTCRIRILTKMIEPNQQFFFFCF
jgi:hypothetical protein